MSVLDDVLARFSTKHNGLELLQFVGVRKPLAAYIQRLRDASIRIMREVGVVEGYWSEPDAAANP